MISSLELCQIVESGFLPLKCRCTVDSARLMSIHVLDPQSGRADLLASGIPTSTLRTSRAIASLISRLKGQLGTESEIQSAQSLQQARRSR
jgi:hypothetical protein